MADIRFWKHEYIIDNNGVDYFNLIHHGIRIKWYRSDINTTLTKVWFKDYNDPLYECINVVFCFQSIQAHVLAR